MPHLVFKLNSVPEDEASEIRQLLEQQNIPFYETDSGRWGLGYAAMWMHDPDQLQQAKSLIQAYQLQRYQKAKSEQQRLELSGERISRIEFFMHSPIKFTALLVFAALLAYFTVFPFL